MAATEISVERLMRQRAEALVSIEKMEAGAFAPTEGGGSSRVQTTQEAIANLRQMVAKFDELIAKEKSRAS
jgi:hypothetical protein